MDQPRIIHFPVQLRAWIRVEYHVDEPRITSIDINTEFPEWNAKYGVRAFEETDNDGDGPDLNRREADELFEQVGAVRPHHLDKIEVDGISFYESTYDGDDEPF